MNTSITLSPKFTQPRILQQTQLSHNENLPQRYNPKFSVRRNLDEEEEGRTITSTRWKIKGLNLNATKVVPVMIPVSSPNASKTHKVISNSSSSNTLMRSISNPTEGHNVKEFHRYNGSSPSQHSLVSASVPNGNTQWQHARVRGSSDIACLSLAQLPSKTGSQTMSQTSCPKTRACSDSSDEFHKARTQEPSDEESDHDFEIEGGALEEGDEEDEDEDCDDDSSVKVEIGGFSQKKQQKNQVTTTTSSFSSSSSRRRNRQYVDLGNITLDCE